MKPQPSRTLYARPEQVIRVPQGPAWDLFDRVAGPIAFALVLTLGTVFTLLSL